MILLYKPGCWVPLTAMPVMSRARQNSKAAASCVVTAIGFPTSMHDFVEMLVQGQPGPEAAAA
jgi:hypothetical protein